MSLLKSGKLVPSLSSVGNKNFNLSIPNQCLAYQVAALLNYNNRLTVVHSWQSIITNLNQYFIEVTGQMMIGCVGLQIGTKMDKILHLSVNISARHKGVGFRLLVTAVNNSNKDTIYMTIREDNFISIALAAKLGFKIIAYKPKYNYNVLTLCLFRRKNVTERAY